MHISEENIRQLSDLKLSPEIIAKNIKNIRSVTKIFESILNSESSAKNIYITFIGKT